MYVQLEFEFAIEMSAANQHKYASQLQLALQV